MCAHGTGLQSLFRSAAKTAFIVARRRALAIWETLGVHAVKIAVAEVLSGHTTLELECVDRLYLNVYVPLLQTGAGASYFFRHGNPVPSLMAPMTRRFVEDLEGCSSEIAKPENLQAFQ